MLCVNMQTSFMHPPFGFALFYLRSVIPKSISSADIYWGALPWVGLQLIMVAIVIFLPITVTFVLDFFEIAFIIVPMLAPVAQKLLTPVVGADAALIWFGVMLCVNMQTSFMHPPFGFALFYLRSVIPKSISSADIYWGALPWVGLQLIMVAIVIFLPITVTFFLDKPHGIDPSTVRIEIAPPAEEDDLPPPSFGPAR
jgi:TRAP-type mannitol/chloroaromatic compound transport system permease large subunit